MNRQQSKARFQEVDIYPVTCERLSAGRSNMEVLHAVIQGGARVIQLREKDYSAKALYHLALEFRKATSKAGVLLIINDHLDIAMAVEADGVHLGQDDLPVAAARRIAPEMLIGASTHSLEEALRAQEEGADYVNIGPIFPTTTKEAAGDCLGPEAISTIKSKIRVPFTVMGGIKDHNLEQVLAKGAQRIAVVTAITQAPDISETVSSLIRRIRDRQR